MGGGTVGPNLRWATPAPMMRVGLLVAAGVLLTSAALWAGSVGPWTARPQSTSRDRSVPTVTDLPTAPTVPSPPPRPAHASGSSLDLSIVLYLLIGVLLVALLMMAVAIIRTRGAAAAAPPRREAAPTTVERFVPPPDADRPFDPREAADYVIACWDQVEQRAAARSSARRPEQTPTEFLESLRAAHPINNEAAVDLLGLYQRARFDHVRLPPDTAIRARADADAVLTGLATSGIAP